MSNRLKIQNILIEADGGGAVHASGPDLASFITKNGTIDWLNLIPDQTFGKKKINRRGVDVSNTKDGGVAHAIAQAMFSADQAESQLQDLGVRVSDLGDQDTIDYYKALKNFQLIISLESPIDELFGGQKDNIEGLAYVDKRSNAKKFIMYFKHDDIVYKMDFSPETLQKNLKGTSFDLPMLIKNGIYEVKISISGSEGGDEEGDSGGGDEGESNQNKTNDSDVDTQTTQYVKLKNDDVNDLNQKVSKLQKSANNIKQLKLKNYSDNKNFRDALLLNLIRSKITNIKINGDPISVTLKKLQSNGLLEAPRSRDINSKQQLPSGWENQMSTFFSNVFNTFVKLNKCCKNNPTYIEIKKFFKLLYLIVKEGQANYSDEKKREQLFKKLVGTIVNFSSALSKTKIEFTNKSSKENTTTLFNVIQEMVVEKTPIYEYWNLNEAKPRKKTKPPRGSQVGKGDSWEDDDTSSEEYEVRLKINDIPTFDEDNVSKSGGDEQILFVGKLKITDDGGNSTWSISGAEDKVNIELRKGVVIRKSMKFDKFLVVEWRNPIDLGGKPTKAMLISPNMDLGQFLSKVVGTGVSDVDVEIGKKVGGDESIEKPAKGKITLKLKS